LTINADFKEVAPAVFLFESDDIDGIDERLLQAHEYLLENKWMDGVIKNTLWEAFREADYLDDIKEIQKNILSCSAIYCDEFDEAIHSIQWQEKLDLIVEFAGSEKITFNPSKSSIMNNNKIDQVPFSRQVCVEYFINDDYDGGDIKWKFFNLPEFKPSRGNILVYPGFFLYTKTVRPILTNKKISIFTSLNGGKDFVSENRSIDIGHNELLFSYMR
jgi:hypothetical protein